MWENVEKYKIVVTNKQVNNRLQVIPNEKLNYNDITDLNIKIRIFIDYICDNSTHFTIGSKKKEKQYFPLSDEAKKYIQTLENVIAEEIANKLMVLKSQNLKINGAYYTGRAFRCESFKEAIAKKMNDLFGDIPPVTSLCDNPNSDKLLCLLALRAIRNGNCPENTYSLPYLKTSQNNDYEGEPKGIGGEILSRFWESFSNNKLFLKILSMLSLNKENPSTEQSIPTFTRLTSSPIISSRYNVDDVDESESYDRAMRCGFTLKVTSENAYLCFDEGDKTKLLKGKSKLFFVNGKFYLVSKQKQNKCELIFDNQQMDLETTRLAFQTFFPNSRTIIPNGNDNIVFSPDTNEGGNKDNEGKTNTQNTYPHKESNENSSSDSDLSQGGNKDKEGKVNTQNTYLHKETNENSSSDSDLSGGF